MSALPGSGTGTPQSFCGFCGFTDTQPFTYCPRCGRPASTSGVLASNISQQLIPSAPTVPGVSETFGEAPTDVRTYPYEAEAPFQTPGVPGAWPPPAGFGGAPAGYPNRYASGGLYPQASDSHRRRRAGFLDRGLSGGVLCLQRVLCLQSD